jgi:hypothetical protein
VTRDLCPWPLPVAVHLHSDLMKTTYLLPSKARILSKCDIFDKIILTLYKMRLCDINLKVKEILQMID